MGHTAQADAVGGGHGLLGVHRGAVFPRADGLRVRWQLDTVVPVVEIPADVRSLVARVGGPRLRVRETVAVLPEMVGGLGVLLVTEMMDECQYQRHKNRNTVIMTLELQD